MPTTVSGTFTFDAGHIPGGGNPPGVVADGVTDDTEALARAVNSAGPDRAVTLNGTCLTTAPIPGFHNTRWEGAGRVVRGGSTFHVNPRGGERNGLHVAPGGTGDGITPGDPLGSFQEAFDILESYGPLPGGRWEIRAAEGVYDFSSGQQALTTPTENTVLVCGPPVGGHPNVPLAVIDGAGGGSYSHGLGAANGGVLVEFRDIKAVNFTAGYGDRTRCAFIGQNQATTNYHNVHVDGASWSGVYAFSTHRNIVKGGIFENCRFGVSNNDTQSSVGYPSQGAIFRKCTQAAVHWSRGSQGHVDYNVFEGNAVGVIVEAASRAAINSCDFKRNDYGIVAKSGGYYGDAAPNEFNVGTVDEQTLADVRVFDTAGDLQELDGALPERLLGYDYTTRSLRTVGQKTVLSAPYAIPARRLWGGGGKAAQVRVLGTLNAAQGTQIEVAFGDARIPVALPVASPGPAAFELTVDLVEVTGGYRMFAKLLQEGTPVRFSTTVGSTRFDPHAAQDVTVSATLIPGSEFIHLYRTEVRITG